MGNLFRRWVGAVVTAAYFATHVAGGYAAEADFWSARRAAARKMSQSPGRSPTASSPTDALVLAQLPGGMRFAAPAPAAVCVPPTTFPGEHRLGGKIPVFAEDLPRWLGDVAAPYGNVRDVFMSKRPGAPLVIHIQDLHDSVEAQKNISDLVAALQDARGISLVGLEGGQGAFATEAFRSFPDAEITKSVATLFMEQGYLGGAEFAGITAPRAPLLWGVEDMADYDANVAAVKESAARRPAMEKFLAEARAVLDQIKVRRLSAPLVEFDRHMSAYQSRRETLGVYVGYLLRSAPSLESQVPNTILLKNALHWEDSMDFKRVEWERTRLLERLVEVMPKGQIERLVDKSALYRLGRISYGDYYRFFQSLCADNGVSLAPYGQLSSYVRYVLLAERINRNDLLNELYFMEREVQDRLVRTALERRIVNAARSLGMLSRLVDHAYTPRDWAYHVLNETEIRSVGQTIQSLAREEGMPFTLSPPAQETIQPFEDFCVQALGRNHVLVKNLLEKMTAERRSSAVLVAGGFHTEGLTQLLRQKDVSYAVITPKIDGPLPEGHRSLDILARDPAPLEKLFAGESVNIPTQRMMGSSNSKNMLVARLTSLFVALTLALHVFATGGSQKLEVPLPAVPTATAVFSDGKAKVTMPSGTFVVSKGEKPYAESVWKIDGEDYSVQRDKRGLLKSVLAMGMSGTVGLWKRARRFKLPLFLSGLVFPSAVSAAPVMATSVTPFFLLFVALAWGIVLFAIANHFRFLGVGRNSWLARRIGQLIVFLKAHPWLAVSTLIGLGVFAVDYFHGGYFQFGNWSEAASGSMVMAMGGTGAVLRDRILRGRSNGISKFAQGKAIVIRNRGGEDVPVLMYELGNDPEKIEAEINRFEEAVRELLKIRTKGDLGSILKIVVEKVKGGIREGQGQNAQSVVVQVIDKMLVANASSENSVVRNAHLRNLQRTLSQALMLGHKLEKGEMVQKEAEKFNKAFTQLAREYLTSSRLIVSHVHELLLSFKTNNNAYLRDHSDLLNELNRLVGSSVPGVEISPNEVIELGIGISNFASSLEATVGLPFGIGAVTQHLQQFSVNLGDIGTKRMFMEEDESFRSGFSHFIEEEKFRYSAKYAIYTQKQILEDMFRDEVGEENEKLSAKNIEMIEEICSGLLAKVSSRLRQPGDDESRLQTRIRDEIDRYERALQEIGQEVSDEDQEYLRRKAESVKKRIRSTKKNAPHCLLAEFYEDQEKAAISADRISSIQTALSKVIMRIERPFVEGGFDMETPVVLVLDGNITPTVLQEMLSSHNVVGIVSNSGTKLSHWMLVSTNKGVPAICGIDDLPQVEAGQDVVLVEDQMVINPNEAALRKLREKGDLASRRQRSFEAVNAVGNAPNDVVGANADSPREVIDAVKKRASFVGLVRSEYLYKRRNPLDPGLNPSKEFEQSLVNTFSALAQNAEGRPVTVRVLDRSEDKASELLLPPDESFGIDYLLRSKVGRKLLEQEISALVLAYKENKNLRVMFPMVSTPADAMACVTTLQRVSKQLKAPIMPFGFMVETPQAVENFESFIDLGASFLSIGTNDLTAASFALSRESRDVATNASRYDVLQPIVLQWIHKVAVGSAQRGVEVSVCGNIAANDEFVAFSQFLSNVRAPIKLSVPSYLIPRVRSIRKSMEGNGRLLNRIFSPYVQGTKKDPGPLKKKLGKIISPVLKKATLGRGLFATALASLSTVALASSPIELSTPLVSQPLILFGILGPMVAIFGLVGLFVLFAAGPPETQEGVGKFSRRFSPSWWFQIGKRTISSQAKTFRERVISVARFFRGPILGLVTNKSVLVFLSTSIFSTSALAAGTIDSLFPFPPLLVLLIPILFVPAAMAVSAWRKISRDPNKDPFRARVWGVFLTAFFLLMNPASQVFAISGDGDGVGAINHVVGKPTAGVHPGSIPESVEFSKKSLFWDRRVKMAEIAASKGLGVFRGPGGDEYTSVMVGEQRGVLNKYWEVVDEFNDYGLTDYQLGSEPVRTSREVFFKFDLSDLDGEKRAEVIAKLKDWNASISLARYAGSYILAVDRGNLEYHQRSISQIVSNLHSIGIKFPTEINWDIPPGVSVFTTSMGIVSAETTVRVLCAINKESLDLWLKNGKVRISKIPQVVLWSYRLANDALGGAKKGQLSHVNKSEESERPAHEVRRKNRVFLLDDSHIEGVVKAGVITKIKIEAERKGWWRGVVSFNVPWKDRLTGKLTFPAFRKWLANNHPAHLYRLDMGRYVGDAKGNLSTPRAFHLYQEEHGYANGDKLIEEISDAVNTVLGDEAVISRAPPETFYFALNKELSSDEVASLQSIISQKLHGVAGLGRNSPFIFVSHVPIGQVSGANVGSAVSRIDHLASSVKTFGERNNDANGFPQNLVHFSQGHYLIADYPQEDQEDFVQFSERCERMLMEDGLKSLRESDQYKALTVEPRSVAELMLSSSQAEHFSAEAKSMLDRVKGWGGSEEAQIAAVLGAMARDMGMDGVALAEKIIETKNRYQGFGVNWGRVGTIVEYWKIARAIPYAPPRHSIGIIRNQMGLVMKSAGPPEIAGDVLRLVFAGKMSDLEGNQSDEHRKKLLTEIQELWAPLAERFGGDEMAMDLRDEAFFIQYPGDYKITAIDLMKNVFPEEAALPLPQDWNPREWYVGAQRKIQRMLGKFEESLRKDPLFDRSIFKVVGRLKTPASIFEKIIRNQESIEDFTDLVAFSVVVEEPISDLERMGNALTGILIKGGSKINSDKTHVHYPEGREYKSYRIVFKNDSRPEAFGSSSVECKLFDEANFLEHKFGVSATWVYNFEKIVGEPTHHSVDIDVVRPEFDENVITFISENQGYFYCGVFKGDFLIPVNLNARERTPKVIDLLAHRKVGMPLVQEVSVNAASAGWGLDIGQELTYLDTVRDGQIIFVKNIEEENPGEGISLPTGEIQIISYHRTRTQLMLLRRNNQGETFNFDVWLEKKHGEGKIDPEIYSEEIKMALWPSVRQRAFINAEEYVEWKVRSGAENELLEEINGYLSQPRVKVVQNTEGNQTNIAIAIQHDRHGLVRNEIFPRIRWVLGDDTFKKLHNGGLRVEKNEPGVSVMFTIEGVDAVKVDKIVKVLGRIPDYESGSDKGSLIKFRVKTKHGRSDNWLQEIQDKVFGLDSLLSVISSDPGQDEVSFVISVEQGLASTVIQTIREQLGKQFQISISPEITEPQLQWMSRAGIWFLNPRYRPYAPWVETFGLFLVLIGLSVYFFSSFILVLLFPFVFKYGHLFFNPGAMAGPVVKEIFRWKLGLSILAALSDPMGLTLVLLSALNLLITLRHSKLNQKDVNEYVGYDEAVSHTELLIRQAMDLGVGKEAIRKQGLTVKEVGGLFVRGASSEEIQRLQGARFETLKVVTPKARLDYGVDEVFPLPSGTLNLDLSPVRRMNSGMVMESIAGRARRLAGGDRIQGERTNPLGTAIEMVERGRSLAPNSLAVALSGVVSRDQSLSDVGRELRGYILSLINSEDRLRKLDQQSINTLWKSAALLFGLGGSLSGGEDTSLGSIRNQYQELDMQLMISLTVLAGEMSGNNFLGAAVESYNAVAEQAAMIRDPGRAVEAKLRGGGPLLYIISPEIASGLKNLSPADTTALEEIKELNRRLADADDALASKWSAHGNVNFAVLDPSGRQYGMDDIVRNLNLGAGIAHYAGRAQTFSGIQIAGTRDRVQEAGGILKGLDIRDPVSITAVPVDGISVNYDGVRNLIRSLILAMPWGLMCEVSMAESAKKARLVLKQA